MSRTRHVRNGLPVNLFIFCASGLAERVGFDSCSYLTLRVPAICYPTDSYFKTSRCSISSPDFYGFCLSLCRNGHQMDTKHTTSNSRILTFRVSALLPLQKLYRIVWEFSHASWGRFPTNKRPIVESELPGRRRAFTADRRDRFLLPEGRPSEPFEPDSSSDRCRDIGRRAVEQQIAQWRPHHRPAELSIDSKVLRLGGSAVDARELRRDGPFIRGKVQHRQCSLAFAFNPSLKCNRKHVFTLGLFGISAHSGPQLLLP